MADITYGVNVEYLSSGNLSLPGGAGGISKAESGMKGLVSAAKSFSETMNNAVNGAAMAGLGIAAAGAIAMFKVGIIGVNSEMEQLNISMAAMFAAHGNVDGFTNGLNASQAIIAKMRIDARELPGEFKDLTKIMSIMTTPSLNAGMSIRETEKMAANAMSSGITHGIHPDVIGREMGAIISGNARHNMPMLTRGMLNLKVDAKELNKMPIEKRLETISRALGLKGGKEGEAMDAMKQAHKNSWVGLTSTAIDNAKQVLGIMTAPLFTQMKGALSFVNDWYDKNASQISDWAEKVGINMGRGFNWAFRELARMEPTLMKIGGWLSGRIEHQQIAGDIGKLAAAGVGIKVGAAVLPSAVSGVAKLPGLLSGAGSVGTGAVAAAGAGEAGVAVAGGGLLGMGVVETGGVLAIVLAALAIAMMAVYGVVEGLTNSLSPLHAEITRLWEGLKSTFSEGMATLARVMDDLSVPLTRISEILGIGLLIGLNAAAEAMNGFLSVLEMITQKLKPFWKLTGLDIPDAKGHTERPEHLKWVPPDLDKKMPPTAPQHTTHIHKVEIKVNSNQDPNRIARTVHGLLMQEARNPRSARINPAAQFSTQ